MRQIFSMDRSGPAKRMNGRRARKIGTDQQCSIMARERQCIVRSEIARRLRQPPIGVQLGEDLAGRGIGPIPPRPHDNCGRSDEVLELPQFFAGVAFVEFDRDGQSVRQVTVSGARWIVESRNRRSEDSGKGCTCCADRCCLDPVDEARIANLDPLDPQGPLAAIVRKRSQRDEALLVRVAEERRGKPVKLVAIDQRTRVGRLAHAVRSRRLLLDTHERVLTSRPVRPPAGSEMPCGAPTICRAPPSPSLGSRRAAEMQRRPRSMRP